jgi:hypothetical protein
VTIAARAAVFLLLVTPGVAGCGAAPNLGPMHDEPVPAGEPRAELRLRVELEPAQDCEEAFDLALYRNRAVDLVQWDTRAGACSGRVVKIRYLSRKITSDRLLAAARLLAVKADPIPTGPVSTR